MNEQARICSYGFTVKHAWMMNNNPHDFSWPLNIFIASTKQEHNNENVQCYLQHYVMKSHLTIVVLIMIMIIIMMIRIYIYTHIYICYNYEKYPLSPLKPRGLELLSWHVPYNWSSGNSVQQSFIWFLSLYWRKSKLYCSRVPILFQNGLLARHSR